MYKIGDEVLVKAEITEVHEECERPYYVVPDFRSTMWVSEEKIIPADKTYADGLRDAWELARKIGAEIDCGGLSNYEVFMMFGTHCTSYVFGKLTYEEALAKIEEWKREEEFKVGDVVESRRSKRKFLIVTEEDDNSDYEFGVIDLETMMIDRICNDSCYYKKTDKHIDIEGLLKQIGE